MWRGHSCPRKAGVLQAIVGNSNLGITPTGGCPSLPQHVAEGWDDDQHLFVLDVKTVPASTGSGFKVG